MVLKSTRAGNYPEWYQNVINEADMAENSENQINRPRKLLFSNVYSAFVLSERG